MRYGRPTNDRKEETIKLRLNGRMRRWIANAAYSQGLTMSEFIRVLIAKDMGERHKDLTDDDMATERHPQLIGNDLTETHTKEI